MTPDAGCAPDQRLVPGGCFLRGVVNGFCMDVHEVTQGAYAACADAGACPPVESTVTRLPGVPEPTWLDFNRACNAAWVDREDHPVNCVDWVAANAYCLAQGRRLPTAEEWEWAARRGREGKAFPWGDQMPTDALVCWSGGLARNGTCAVGSHPDGANPWGIEDLSGNVLEYTSNAFLTPDEVHLGHGGSWYETLPERVVASMRLSAVPTLRTNGCGFRCAATP